MDSSGDHIVLQDEERKTIHKCGKEGFKIYEALTLIYINDNTNISVPKIRSIQYEDGRELNVRYDEAGKPTYIRYEDDKVYEVKYDEQGKSTYTPYGNDDVVQITMDFVEGDTLEKVWKDFTYDQKEVLAGDLKRCVSELRKLKGEKIAALNDGKVRVLSSSRYVQEGGPFESREEFNQFLELIGVDTMLHASQDDILDTMPYASLDDNSSSSGYSSKKEDAPQGCEEFVFSHGDILPRNILVNDQGMVTALVDWEFAGYLPLYWEYSRASRESKDWKEFLLLWVFPDKREWGYTEMKSLDIRS
ncbi:aminoglycoside phosphotransferase [Aspergillus oryzae]|uniref:Aminoglycoside phosphotransferase n=1 Tax=Aspergillus oryzae TaxID=5062 RepID=A0A1S9D7W6_ASPOZ|nr:aminoglycoside phosphotransferase [Aspergillus oryzae]